MAVRAAFSSATGMGGAGSGLEGSAGGAGARAHQSPSRRSAGPSTHTVSSLGKSGLAAFPSGCTRPHVLTPKCGKTRSRTHVPAGSETPLRPAAS
eukprot:465336-Alexandrium_andersonii.AAC.1